MSVCTGAFVLASTGLLSGKSATTHHNAFGEFALEFPDVQLRRGARFVEDGHFASAGGLTSGIDLALRVVERYYGRETARKTADAMEGTLGTDSHSAGINACRRRETRRLREDLNPSERRSLRFRCWNGTSCELAGRRTSCQRSGYESRHKTWRRSRSRIRHRLGELHEIRRRASILRRDTRLADSLHGNVPSHNRSDRGLDTSRSDVAPRLRSKDRRPSPIAMALRARTNPSPHNRRIDMGNRPHTCLHRHIAGHRASTPSHIGSYKPIGRSVAVEATRVPAALCRRRRRPAGRPPDRGPTPAHATAGLQEAPAAACPALRPKGAPS